MNYENHHKCLLLYNNVSFLAVSGNTMGYAPADVTKLTSLSPVLDKVEAHSSVSGVSYNGFPVRNKSAGVRILLSECLYESKVSFSND